VHAVPPLGHRHELVLAEVAEEALADAGEVGRPRVGEQLVALVRQDREAAAPVGRARVAHQQPLALEAVDQPRHAGAREQHAVGQLGHPQPAPGRGAQVDQDVVVAQRERVRLLELGIQRAHERRVRPQHPAPGGELDRRELVGRDRRRRARG
jgi:hypothetical protein